MLCFLWADLKELCSQSVFGVRIVWVAASYSVHSENIFSCVSRKLFSSATWEQQLKYSRILSSQSYPFPNYICDGQCNKSSNKSENSFFSFSSEIWQGRAVLLPMSIMWCSRTGRRHPHIQINSFCVHQKVFPICCLSVSQNTFSVAHPVTAAEWYACYFIFSLLCPTELSVALIICTPMGYCRMCFSIAWWEKGSFSLSLLLDCTRRSVLFLRDSCGAFLLWWCSHHVSHIRELNSSTW